MGFEWGGLIIGAIIGAIVGGFTAAITGGDVSKGMLYGAAAGAILYGVNWAISAYSSTGATTASAGSNAAGWGGSAGEAAATGKAVGGARPISSSITANTPKSISNWESFKSFASSDGGGMLGQAGIMMGGQAISGAAGAKAASQEAAETRRHQAEENRLAREHASAMLDKQHAAGSDNTVGLANIAEQRRSFDLAHNQSVREYEELRKERLDSISNARGALESAVVSRKNTARPDSPSILQQIKDERAINPETMPVADEEGNIAYV